MSGSRSDGDSSSGKGDVSILTVCTLSGSPFLVVVMLARVRGSEKFILIIDGLCFVNRFKTSCCYGML